MRSLIVAKAVIVLAIGGTLAAASAAPPPCGRKACKEEIVDICEGLEGRDRADCAKGVIAACKESPDQSACQEGSTTTSTSTTSSTSTTTIYGSPSQAFLTSRHDLLD